MCFTQQLLTSHFVFIEDHRDDYQKGDTGTELPGLDR